MVIYPSIDSLLSKIDSKYTLVILAAKRAREIVDGNRPPAEESASAKPVTIALEEIAQDKITFKRTRTGIK
ncbi:rna polymerase subunit omega/k/rpb6 [Lucifera butyrica]|uniref:DNA-directed RNA polymerase subunit omega n=1 Tax=Lucifera butyrica TaxID=1351585 RepID=A0A498R1W9_9FIRM|nr:DNA-directed RNA polymerase subunit omega [Lucifera butyrica]VBB05155.1 rna polymerase subunit omega/k/rpb6 [Lucifera butyrica]